MANPYSSLSDHHFWRRAVSVIEPHRLDPIVETKFSIDPADRVVTAGSCFAQHISRQLVRMGFQYFVPENGEHLDESERDRRHYGMFSARFGNIYTTAQLLQLFQEAFEGCARSGVAVQRADGRWVDALRPLIEPDGYADPEGVLADRTAHLVHVRTMFAEADVLIFTLGLTEAWRSRVDGSVLPLAPGVVGGSFDPALHEFVNFDVTAVTNDLAAFLAAFRAVNPRGRVLLTVSPVPLIATFEQSHVLVATTYSKAVLRVAAEMAARQQDWVDYFPSYEIITGSFSGGRYYEDDAREVNRKGVAHAMRCFASNYAPAFAGCADRHAPPSLSAATAGSGIICDEEALNAVKI